MNNIYIWQSPYVCIIYKIYITHSTIRISCLGIMYFSENISINRQIIATLNARYRYKRFELLALWCPDLYLELMPPTTVPLL